MSYYCDFCVGRERGGLENCVHHFPLMIKYVCVTIYIISLYVRVSVREYYIVESFDDCFTSTCASMSVLHDQTPHDPHTCSKN